jgi:hypothetical protein
MMDSDVTRVAAIMIDHKLGCDGDGSNLGCA